MTLLVRKKPGKTGPPISGRMDLFIDCFEGWSAILTLSPIMVQWKMGPLNERKLILEIHPFSTEA